jgi:hypothetical protein
VHWNLLVRRTEHEPAQARRPIGGPLRLVFLYARVTSDYDPDARVAGEHLDPFEIGCVPAARQILDVEGLMAEVRY